MKQIYSSILMFILASNGSTSLSTLHEATQLHTERSGHSKGQTLETQLMFFLRHSAYTIRMSIALTHTGDAVWRRVRNLSQIWAMALATSLKKNVVGEAIAPPKSSLNQPAHLSPS